MLSADERVGQLFVLALLLQTELGRDVLQPRFQLDFDDQRDKAKAQLSGVQSACSSEGSLSQEETELDQNDAGDELDEGTTDGETDSEGSLSQGGKIELEQNDADELEQTTTNRETEDQVEDEYEEAISTGNLSEAKIELALDNLDLSYIFTQIRPGLDCFHRERLDIVLGEVLTKSAFRAV
jgi:hypothetical protein